VAGQNGVDVIDEIYSFGPFELSASERVLRHAENIVPIPPKAMAALIVLVKAEGRVVSKADLIGQVWPDTFVEEGTLAQTVSILRRQLMLDKRAENPIETISRVGYRIRTPITAISPEPEPEQTAVESSEAGIVVLDAAVALDALAITESGAPPAVEQPRSRLLPVLALLILLGVAATLLLHRILLRQPATSIAAAKPAPVSPSLLYPVTSVPEGDKVSAAAVSPDGRKLAYSDRAGVSVHTFAGGEQLLPSRPSFFVDRISWFPDNARVLMSGIDSPTHEHQVWEVPLIGGYARQLAADADLAVASPDGTSIAYTRKHDSELWLAEAGGENPHKLTSDAAGSFPYLIWAPSGDRLLLDHKTASGEAYESVDAHTGAVLDREASTPFSSGYLLPDGRLYFTIKGSDSPFGSSRLMSVHTELRTGRFLDKPRKVHGLSGSSRSLSASADGKRFAVVLDRSNIGIFVANLRVSGASLEDVSELPNNQAESYPHGWTADGSAVVLENTSLGKWAIFTQPLDGSVPQLIARLPDSIAMEQLTPDGRWIMFMRFARSDQPANGIYRVPVSGGAVEKVPVTGQIEDFRCSVLAIGSCVLRELIGNTELVYRELDPIQGVGRELARTPWQPILMGDWGLSPDGTTVAITDHDTIAPRIRLVKLRTSPVAINELPLRGHGTLQASSWAADGKSLFVECRTAEGFELLDVDFGGHAKLLRKSEVPIWAIPSRDGRKLAFPGRTVSSNAWTTEVSPD
jgi:DNA-binding winged helix-turn-helix (wHTH) protein/Tol biopolymer transport system component